MKLHSLKLNYFGSNMRNKFRLHILPHKTDECLFDFDIPRLGHSKKTSCSNAFQKGKRIVMAHERINVNHLIH